MAGSGPSPVRIAISQWFRDYPCYAALEGSVIVKHLDELERRVLAVNALTWTSEPPNEPGKFWVRWFDASIQMEVDDIVDITGLRVPPDDPGVFTYFVDDRPLSECEEYQGALWAGPVLLPEPAPEEA